MWIFIVVFVVMLGLYAYTVLWTGFGLNKKGQPLLDVLFGHKNSNSGRKPE